MKKACLAPYFSKEFFLKNGIVLSKSKNGETSHVSFGRIVIVENVDAF